MAAPEGADDNLNFIHYIQQILKKYSQWCYNLVL